MSEQPVAEPPQAVLNLLAGHTALVQQIALELRALVLQMAPAAIEQIDLPAHMLAYGFKATYKELLCVIMPTQKYVNFGFPHGASMSDPAGLLQGTGKRARHVKVTSLEDARRSELRGLLQVALQDLNRSVK